MNDGDDDAVAILKAHALAAHPATLCGAWMRPRALHHVFEELAVSVRLQIERVKLST
jgi:hypothetical protein